MDMPLAFVNEMMLVCANIVEQPDSTTKTIVFIYLVLELFQIVAAINDTGVEERGRF